MPRPAATSARSLADEQVVERLFDCRQQHRIEIATGVDRGEDPAPAIHRVAPAQGVADPLLPVAAPRDLGPRRDPHRRRPHALPHVDVRVTDHQCTGLGGGAGKPGLLAAGHQMVDEHGESTYLARRERSHGRGQIVDPAERFDDDAQIVELVTPHPLDQAGVVVALDPQSRGPSHPRRCIGIDQRAGCRRLQRRAGRRRGRRRCDEQDGLAVDGEGSRDVAQPVPGARRVLDDHLVTTERPDPPTEIRAAVEHAQTGHRGDRRHRLLDDVEDVAGPGRRSGR